MSQSLAKLEAEVDAVLARSPPGRPDAALLGLSSEWARAVWKAAMDRPPLELTDSTVRRGLELAKRPVFICGVHRSGTTLVRDLLDGHPALAVLPAEGTFFSNLEPRLTRLPRSQRLRATGEEWVRRLANPINRPPYWLLGRSGERRAPYVDFARRLQAWWPVLETHLGRRCRLWPLIAVVLSYTTSQRAELAPTIVAWVEKTPTNEMHLRSLRAALPAAKIIQLVRDPLAIYASRRRLEERSRSSFSMARRALVELARSFVIAGRAPFPGVDRHLVLRYEELVADTAGVAKRLAAFLGIEPRPELRQPTVAGLPATANSSFDEPCAAGHVMTTPAHRELQLTAAERELVAAYAGASARRLGYRLETPSLVRRTWLKLRLVLGGRV